MFENKADLWFERQLWVEQRELLVNRHKIAYGIRAIPIHHVDNDATTLLKTDTQR